MTDDPKTDNWRAAKDALSDGELADLIHELSDEMERRLRAYHGLKGQCEAASLAIRSWSTQHQRNMHGQI